MYYVLAPNGTVVDRVASLWMGELVPRLMAAMEAAGATKGVCEKSTASGSHERKRPME
jgi:hypothetical protein